jgi:hypothetical protein
VAKAGQTAVNCLNYGDAVPPILKFNNVYSPSGSAYGGICTDQTGMSGNISVDPLFVFESGDDYHLDQGSLAIDAGDNTVSGLPALDFDGNSRIIDGDGNSTTVVDIGAYEFIP